MRQDRTLLLYALVKGFELDVGRIIKEFILDCAENNFSGNIPYPTLITLLCIKRGIKVAEDEEKSSKASPPTRIGVLKTTAKDEEVKRIKMRKMVEKEQPWEIIPTVEADREFENEERGVFKDYTEQLVLFPATVEEITAPPIRTENRGKQRAKVEENSSSKLLFLMKYVRKRNKKKG